MSFAYRWFRASSAIAGATSNRYTVQIPDEAQPLSCSVTASNGGGASTASASARVIVALPGTLTCPHPSGSVHGGTIGPLALGLSRGAARSRLHRYHAKGPNIDDFCLYAGWGIRVGYASAKLLAGLPRSQRSAISGKVILALTANPYYSLDGVKPGATVKAATARLHLGKVFHVGLNDWYLGTGAGVRAVVKVRGGIVQEIGVANAAITKSIAAQRRFLTSFSAE
jgi:hypothetical protein